jgi:hypothetical protein
MASIDVGTDAAEEIVDTGISTTSVEYGGSGVDDYVVVQSHGYVKRVPVTSFEDWLNAGTSITTGTTPYFPEESEKELFKQRVTQLENQAVRDQEAIRDLNETANRLLDRILILEKENEQMKKDIAEGGTGWTT